jgi:DNA polymerase-3 subunit epsilon
MTLRGSFLAIDFETASKDRASACALGFAHVVDGGVDASGSTLIDPRLPADAWCFGDVHGIEPQDVVGAPTFAAVWAELDARFPGELLVGNNASFDIGVLRAELERAGVRPIAPIRSRCSAAIARLAWPAIPRVTLAHLTATLGIPLKHHDAGSDAQACAAVLLHAADALGVSDVAALPDVWRMGMERAA